MIKGQLGLRRSDLADDLTSVIGDIKQSIETINEAKATGVNLVLLSSVIDLLERNVKSLEKMRASLGVVTVDEETAA